MSHPAAAPGGSSRQALAAGIAGYVMWGLVPALFILAGRTGASPWEIVGQRALWSLPWAGLLVVLAGHGHQVALVFRTPRLLGQLAISALMIVSGWSVHLPLIALFLAVTFTIYGVIRKRVAVDAQAGLFIESLLMFLPGLALVLWLAHAGVARFATGAPITLMLLAMGPVTVAPLAFFAWTTRRLPLSTVGFLQFTGPTLGFLIGLVVGERLTTLGLISFAFIWAGVALFMFGAWRAGRRIRLATASAAA
jgi:chloramphenicol-sensitive protein RarD